MATSAEAARVCTNCQMNENPLKKLKSCGECKTTLYCSKDCQTQDWKAHKLICSGSSKKSSKSSKQPSSSYDDLESSGLAVKNSAIAQYKTGISGLERDLKLEGDQLARFEEAKTKLDEMTNQELSSPSWNRSSGEFNNLIMSLQREMLTPSNTSLDDNLTAWNKYMTISSSITVEIVTWQAICRREGYGRYP